MDTKDVTANLAFERELRARLANWDQAAALELSMSLHKHEVGGGEITATVDRLWEKLSLRLEGGK